ncbi:adenylosuccinate lyase family protein [Pokkaliibacter sp. MBI-7]|uniref:class-II fumarase/aspartase family protein n=1 Tax=Pokkaliibacter sp. MBI-7 TaxID=3040600 RepID=UPI0024469C9E|nr:adenylosuccinate lyase family protein [Pokkaliibacter sp. MBI-7]MDH2433557.1 adenylosuccinate lyase family protein [Pokkaliibacter sp. MBI-7]
MYTRLFQDPFTSPALRQLLSAESYMRSMLEVELQLVRVQEEEGQWPQGTAQQLREALAESPLLDYEVLAGIGLGGNVAIPFVKHIRELLPAGLKRCLHYGPTSQDIVDTALMLELRKALLWFERKGEALEGHLRQLVEQHRHTLMIGRTLMQQALPITFGLKAAGWLQSVRQASQRLQGLKSELLQLQFGGAAGTLAALGADGLTTHDQLAQALELAAPAMPWHTNRQSMHALFTALDAVAVSLEKIAGDVALMAQTEVGEVAEPAGEGMGESSSMPHKRNPVRCALIHGATRQIHGLVTTHLTNAAHPHERALGGWHTEWSTLYEAMLLLGGALEQAEILLAGLEVFPARMRANLYTTQGVIMAEPVSLELAQRMPRDLAMAAVKTATRVALAEQIGFTEALYRDELIQAALSRDELEQLAAPESYLGATQGFIDRVLAQGS